MQALQAALRKVTVLRFRHQKTALARFIVRWLPWPPSLLLAAWRWLAAEADDLGEKRRCIEAILRLTNVAMWLRKASWR